MNGADDASQRLQGFYPAASSRHLFDEPLGSYFDLLADEQC